MTPQEYQATKRSQRRDLGLLALLFVSISALLMSLPTEPVPVQTGAGYETCTTTEC